MSMAILYQIGEDGSKAERWEVGDEPIVVGRSGLARVSIEDDGLSRRHFMIARDGEDFVIKDLNSRNGTWVGGCRVFAEKLHHNDSILAGRTQFLFAQPVSLSTAEHQPLRGPHGTQVICAAPKPEQDFSELLAWQEDGSGQPLEAVA
jgi:pSer/pThr/pTyr-binding forkhead associated (FHA) protein